MAIDELIEINLDIFIIVLSRLPQNDDKQNIHRDTKLDMWTRTRPTVECISHGGDIFITDGIGFVTSMSW